MGGGTDSNLLIVNATATKNGNSWNVVADASWGDVKTAYDSGKFVVLKGTINPNDGRPQQYYERREYVINQYQITSTATFASTYLQGSSVLHKMFTVSDAGGWSYLEEEIPIS